MNQIDIELLMRGMQGLGSGLSRIGQLRRAEAERNRPIDPTQEAIARTILGEMGVPIPEPVNFGAPALAPQFVPEAGLGLGMGPGLPEGVRPVTPRQPMGGLDSRPVVSRRANDPMPKTQAAYRKLMEQAPLHFRPQGMSFADRKALLEMAEEGKNKRSAAGNETRKEIAGGVAKTADARMANDYAIALMKLKESVRQFNTSHSQAKDAKAAELALRELLAAREQLNRSRIALNEMPFGEEMKNYVANLEQAERELEPEVTTILQNFYRRAGVAPKQDDAAPEPNIVNKTSSTTRTKPRGPAQKSAIEKYPHPQQPGKYVVKYADGSYGIE